MATAFSGFVGGVLGGLNYISKSVTLPSQLQSVRSKSERKHLIVCMYTCALNSDSFVLLSDESSYAPLTRFFELGCTAEAAGVSMGESGTLTSSLE